MKIRQILWLIPDRQNYLFISYSQALKQLNYQVTLFDHTEQLIELGIDEMYSQIINHISSLDRESSLVIASFYHYSMALTPEFLKKISEKIALIIWSFDDEIYSTSQTFYQAQSAHAIITTDFYGRGIFEQLDIPTFFFPAPTIDLTILPTIQDKKIDIAFVGDCRKSNRHQYLNTLKEAGFRVEIFGRGSKNGFISRQKMREIFANSKICLNFTGSSIPDSIAQLEPWRQHIHQLKGRPFEICASGSFCLTEWVSHLEKCFSIGREIDCFCDLEELLAKARFYLTHDTIREEMAKTAYEKVNRDVLSLKSLEQVFLDLEMEILGNKLFVRKKEIVRSDYFRFLEVFFAALMAIKMIQRNNLGLAMNLLKQFKIFSFNSHHIYHLTRTFFTLVKMVYRRIIHQTDRSSL
ncbi:MULTISPECIES: glycosyltransferase [Spirulina sp. CCY15215]|uniref:glycosyltransferase family protein n=1 Tax=Spirulina sp. CCY15215 TaxID=2767591 RepID=UPI0019518B30|nr:glycosyltransferase [Spirulina major]